MTLIKKYFKNYSGLPKTCRYGITLCLIESSLNGVCFFLSFYFIKWLKINIATAGIIISCYAIGTACGGILGGKLCDKSSPHLIGAISLILEAITFYALTQTSNSILLMFILFFLGLSIYGFLTANNLFVIQQCDSEAIKLRAINILYAASNFGFGMAAIIIIFLAQKGFHSVFYLSSIVLLLFGIHFLFYEKKSTIKITLIKKNIMNSSLTPNDKKTVFLVLTCLFLVGFIVSQRSAVYLIYINTLFPKNGIMAMCLVFILNPLLVAFFQTPIVNYFQEFNKILMVGIGAFLMGLGTLMLNFSFFFLIIILACIIYTLGEILFFSIAQFLCYQKGENNKKGQSLGIFKTVYATSTIIGPTLSGIIYHYLNSTMLWYLDGILGLFCLTSCIYFNTFASDLSAHTDTTSNERSIA